MTQLRRAPSKDVALARGLLILLARDRRRLLSFIARRCGSSSDQEDVLQQSLLRAAERIESLRDPERLRACSEDQLIVRSVDLDDVPVAEVAAAMGLTTNAVRV